MHRSWSDRQLLLLEMGSDSTNEARKSGHGDKLRGHNWCPRGACGPCRLCSQKGQHTIEVCAEGRQGCVTGRCEAMLP